MALMAYVRNVVIKDKSLAGNAKIWWIYIFVTIIWIA